MVYFIVDCDVNIDFGVSMKNWPWNKIIDIVQLLIFQNPAPISGHKLFRVKIFSPNFQGLEPDGYAEHHEQVNETTAFDMSNSEFWSSFSSSEEALLECEGLILNLPLTPHSFCHKDASDDETFSAAKANALTYRYD